jgi:hypothetical protein
MKKCSNLFFLVLACAAAATAQTSPTVGQQSPTVSADAPAGVTVVKFNWERVPRRAVWESPAGSAADQTVENPRSGGIPLPVRNDDGKPVPIGPSSSAAQRERERSQASRNSTSAIGSERLGSNNSRPGPASGVADYLYQLRITNGGERRVESVDWEYLFLEPGTQKELGRHRFLSPRRAKPGETFTLKVGSLSPPARVVSAVSLDKKRKPFDERIVVRCVAYSDGTFARRAGAAEADCDSLREASERARRRRQ